MSEERRDGEGTDLQGVTERKREKQYEDITTHGCRTTQRFLIGLHEFYFTTDGNKIVEILRCIVPNFINE